MARTANIRNLIKLVQKLKKQRAFHRDALATIDAAFAAMGVEAGGEIPVPFLRAPAAEAAPSQERRKRGKFKQTAVAFILDLLKAKGHTTAQVNAAWTGAGRGGKADNALLKLVKEKKLTKKPVKDGRGSVYSLA